MPAAKKVENRRNSNKRKSNLKEESSAEKLVRKLPDLAISEKSGEILTLGTGDVGQLGLGDSLLERKRPTPVKEVDGVKFTEITCGGMHSVGVTDSGEVYTWGCNDDGALGRTTNGDDGEEYFPRKVDLPDGVVVVNVSAGDSHTAAITTRGEVYAWGSYRDTSGCIGLTSTQDSGQKSEVVKIFPTAEDPDAFAKKVASGNDHTIILTNDGVIYSNGSGEQGQLGRVKECFGHRGGRRGLDKVLSPQIVRLRKKIYFSDIFCGSFCTFALSREDNLVYAWGLNNYGQLGSGNTVDYFNPEIMRPLSELRKSTSGPFQIAAGQHHTILVDEEGITYCIGRAEYGRLGLGDGATETPIPLRIPALEEVRVGRVACGEVCSFAISHDGHLYSWGIGTSLQLGVGDDEDVTVPTQVKSKFLNPETDEVISVRAGGQHTCLLSRKKSVT